MKIIDLLNKIANGEQPPRRIYYKGNAYIYNKEEKDYESEVFVEYLFDSHIITDILNDEVEILETTITYNSFNYLQKLTEDEIPDKIKKLKILNSELGEYVKNKEHNNCFISKSDKVIINKINEIIDRVKNL